MSHNWKASCEKEKLEARYADNFKVGYTAFKFVFDFGQFHPGSGKTQSHTRITTSPITAKVFFEMLRESIEHYEQSFGPIQE